MQANRAALAELKAFQERVRLEDEVAAEAIKEASRAYAEGVLAKGIASTKKRTRVRDHSEAVRVRYQLFVQELMMGYPLVRPLRRLASCARHELRQGMFGSAYMRGRQLVGYTWDYSKAVWVWCLHRLENCFGCELRQGMCGFAYMGCKKLVGHTQAQLMHS